MLLFITCNSNDVIFHIITKSSSEFHFGNFGEPESQSQIGWRELQLLSSFFWLTMSQLTS